MTTQFLQQKVLHLGKELEKKNPKIVGEYLITTKKEGWWVTIPYIVGQGWQNPLSGAMREIPSLTWVGEYLNKNFRKPKESCFLIAEAIIPDLTFEKLNGVLNRSVGSCWCTDVVFQLHDIIALAGSKLASLTALERYNTLQSIDFSCVRKHFTVLPILEASVFNLDLWTRRFEQELNKDEEGIVMKQAGSIYAFGKRNSTLLKLKMECEKDLRCSRLEESIGVRGNKGYTLVSKGLNGVEVRTVVNNHEEQGKLYQLYQAGELANHVVKVRAMRELEDGNLKEPVYVGLREDKDIKDID